MSIKPFEIFEGIEETPQENLKRAALQQPVTALTNIAGTPGDIAGAVGGIGDFFSNLLPDDKSKKLYSSLLEASPMGTLKNIPGREKIRSWLYEKIPSLKPQTETESKAQEALDLFVDVLGPNKAKSALKRALLGTGLGMGAKEALKASGASETTQELGKMGLGSLPSLLKGRLSPSDFSGVAREAGLTEKQLTPLLKSERTAEMLSRTGKLTGSAERQLLGSEEKLRNYTQNLIGEAFQGIRRNEAGFKKAAGELYEPLKNEASKVMVSLNPNPLREKIMGYVDELSNTKVTSPETKQAIEALTEAWDKMDKGKFGLDTAINTFQELNKSIDWSRVSKGGAIIESFKNDLVKAMSEAGSKGKKIANDFRKTTDLYKNAIKIEPYLKSLEGDFSKVHELINSPTSRKVFQDVLGDRYGDFEEAIRLGQRNQKMMSSLKGGRAKDFLEKMKYGDVILAIVQMNPSLLIPSVGLEASQRLMTQVLFDPFYQKTAQNVLRNISSNPKMAAQQADNLFRKIKEELPSDISDKVDSDSENDPEKHFITPFSVLE